MGNLAVRMGNLAILSDATAGSGNLLAYLAQNEVTCRPIDDKPTMKAHE